MTTTLYRLFDEERRLLYIGIAGNPGRRFEQHAKDKPWWSTVAHTALEHFPTRPEAEAAERRAIVAERPLHNIVHNHSATTRRSASLPENGEGRWRIFWACDVCGGAVNDGEGYIEMPHRERLRYRNARAAWEASHPQRPGLSILSAAEFALLPARAHWFVLHRDCDPVPDGDGYHFDIERCRYVPQVLQWTIHLAEKSWINETDWFSTIASRAIWNFGVERKRVAS